MAREIVLRKRSRDGNRVCTVYGISEPSYKFTFETCDDIEATIKDSKGNTVSVLSLNAPTSIVSRKGNYNVCIEGIGIGTLYAEWGSHPPDPGDECCEELRLKDIDLQLQIDNLRTRINNQNITAGEGISVTKTGDSYTITNTYPGGGSDVDIVAGNNVQVSKSGNTYTISATDTIPDVNKQYVDEQIAANKTIVEAGANVTVTRNGNVYTVSSSGGGGGGALPVDFNIIGGQNVQVSKNGNAYTISATDTITSVRQGTNTTVTKNGNEYTVNAVDTVTTVKAGDNVTVTKNGNEYTVSATGGGSLPSDFAINAGNNVQVSKSGNAYTISATDTDTITTVKQGTNTTVTKNGNEYTVNAVDTITTVKAGTNVTVTKSGNEYTVNATDTDTKPILLQELVATCDIGGIASGTRYPVGTTLEKILRDLLTCTTPPTPTKQYPWFTSEVVNRATAEERWIEFAVDPDTGTHTFDLAKTYEEIPVKFDVPAELAPLTLELYNEIFARWEVNTRDFTISNITRTIDGENVSYLRYTDAREVNGASRPVRMTWNP